MQPIEETRERLGRLLRSRWDGSCSITDLRQVGGGASRETWIADVLASGERSSVVLQRHLGDDLGGASTEVQSAAMAAARATGVPVPEVLAVLHPEDGLGSGMITAFVRGETNPRRILSSPELADVRPRLARECGEALAHVHAVDPAAAGLEFPPGDVPPLLREIERCEAMLNEIDEPHPAFEIALQWLRHHVVETEELVLVHGDFRNGNLIIGEDGIRGVLDWELTHVGDPLEDLAWLCVRAWRFDATDRPVGGFGHRDELLDAYEAASGRVAKERNLRTWELLGAVRWGVICMQQASRHLDGPEESAELAAIGRRVCECEYDALLTLSALAPETYDAPVAWEPGEGLRASTGMTVDRPDAADLLTAVAISLRADVASELDGRARFLSLVAANACRVVARELRHGPRIEEEMTSAYRLLFPDSPDAVRAAAWALRTDAVSCADPDVVRTVTSHVGAKLFLSNPKYFQTPDETE